MAREDYNQIRDKFAKYIEIWKTKKVEELEALVIPDAKCYMSIVKAYPCGSQHSIYGVRDFILDMAQTDEFHTRICNYAARFDENTAAQIATVVCRVAKYVGEDSLKSFEFSMMFANKWVKEGDDWKMSEIRMDMVDAGGDFEEFSEKWYMEDSHAKWFVGVHLPVINGELDSPWVLYPECENVLTEEEAILETFAHYAFGIDTLSFEHVRPCFAEDMVGVMAPWGTLDKRSFMTTMKYHRQPARYWTHSVLPESIEIKGNEAFVKAYRMAGHKQRNHPLVITKDNVNTEHACARYEMRLRKENNQWKITRIEYFLGILDIGPYTE